MQTLYTFDSIRGESNPADANKLLLSQFAQTRKLLVYLIHFLGEVARYAEKDAHKKSTKHLPSASDLNISTKIAGNELLWKILEDTGFIAARNETHVADLTDESLVKAIYGKLTETEEYTEYNETPARDKKSEKEILQFIFTQLMLPDEEFINHIEELFINWDDDGEMMNLLMQNYLQKPHQFNFQELVSSDKMQFATSLLKTVLAKKEVSLELIRPKLKNWDADRIAALDLIIIQMGIAEFLYFETIPTKVTINEYIDLAKEYSTPQSGQFINGILDNIHKELLTKDLIHKTSFKNTTHG